MKETVGGCGWLSSVRFRRPSRPGGGERTPAVPHRRESEEELGTPADSCNRGDPPQGPAETTSEVYGPTLGCMDFFKTATQS